MQFTLSLLYFVGLIIFGVAFASLRGIPEFGFMIIGGGAVIFAFVAWIINFFKPNI